MHKTMDLASTRTAGLDLSHVPNSLDLTYTKTSTFIWTLVASQIFDNFCMPHDSEDQPWLRFKSSHYDCHLNLASLVRADLS